MASFKFNVPFDISIPWLDSSLDRIESKIDNLVNRQELKRFMSQITDQIVSLQEKLNQVEGKITEVSDAVIAESLQVQQKIADLSNIVDDPNALVLIQSLNESTAATVERMELLKTSIAGILPDDAEPSL